MSLINETIISLDILLAVVMFMYWYASQAEK